MRSRLTTAVSYKLLKNDKQTKVPLIVSCTTSGIKNRLFRSGSTQNTRVQAIKTRAGQTATYGKLHGHPRIGTRLEATSSLQILQHCGQMTEIHNCYKPWEQRGENRPSGLVPKPKTCLLPVCKIASMWTCLAMILVTVKLSPKVCSAGKGKLLDAKNLSRIVSPSIP